MRRMQLFFRLGSWMLILTAALHMVGFFERTTLEVLEGFSLSSAILTLFVGVSNLVMMRVHHGRIKGLRVMALLNTVLSTLMFVLSWAYFILPLLICWGLCLLFFGLAFAAGQYQSEWERTASKMA